MDLWTFFVVFLLWFCTYLKIVLTEESKLLTILLFAIFASNYSKMVSKLILKLNLYKSRTALILNSIAIFSSLLYRVSQKERNQNKLFLSSLR